MIRELRLQIAKTYRPFDPNKSPGVYVSVSPTERTRQHIEEWSSILGLPLSIDEASELHCTVVYSKVVPKVMPPLDSTKIYKARLLGIAWWDGHDKEGYLVMKLGSTDLAELNRQWMSAGCISNFPTYQPHVTFKKDVGPMPQDFMARRKRLYRTIGSGLEFTNAQLEGLKP
jgi:hypothetical protein